jgi:hypothetical protein
MVGGQHQFKHPVIKGKGGGHTPGKGRTELRPFKPIKVNPVAVKQCSIKQGGVKPSCLVV